MLNVFIDESGDQGFNFEKGSSKHFLIGFAFFPTTDYKRCVDSVKQGIGARCGKAPKHLHFNSSRDAEKKELLHKMVAVGGPSRCPRVQILLLLRQALGYFSQ